MSRQKHRSTFIWRLMRRMSSRVIRLVAAGRGPAGVVLVLTTTGRKSGLPRQTPLQYEQVGEDFYIASARGPQADWFRNLQVDPRVTGAGGRQAVPRPGRGGHRPRSASPISWRCAWRATRAWSG